MRKMNRVAFAASTLAIAGAFVAGPAFAQSTGSVDFENTIVVSGVGQKAVNGVDLPATPKAKQVLDQAFISRAIPGQSINDTIGMIPGVASFNADPFGSSGGKLYIRGFDNTRISETFDGMPLNDTGGYALYSNQMLDPELIDQVNVNLGTTDVDSPTASATGSTVNYRSRNPTEDFHARMVGSVGEYGFMRIFGVIDTGNLTKSGLRAWVSASSSTNNLFSGVSNGGVDKKQFNFKIYQPLSNGDFISLAGHWNRNRNTMAPSIYLWNENYGSRTVGSASSNRYPTNWSEAFYNLGSCSANPSLWECRYNPSNTGNLRINSRFTLTDKLVLTVDPSIQYTKANGGGTATGTEATCTSTSCGTATTGYIGSSYYFGRDLNGDGDLLDKVTLAAPSETETYRLGLNMSLRYRLNDSHTLRVNYTYDRGRHRQTGELAYLNSDGMASQYFPIDNPVTDASGNVIQKRNRLSYAILHQVSGEYNGRFFGDRLEVTAGLRVPFLKRNLNNYCFTTSNQGYVDCLGNSSMNAAYAALHSNYAAPQQRIFNYSKVLPSAGFTVKVTKQASMFFNYSKGMQVPGTDNLYQSFYYAQGTAQANPTPESTDNFDLGLRFRSRKVMGQLGGWYTLFHNRLASSYDQDLQATIYRNLGTVEKYGLDASVTVNANKYLSAYGFVSLMRSRIVSNVASGNGTYFATAGKRESGAPVSTMGARIDGHFDPLDIGVQVKRTGGRFINDQNLPVYVNGVQVSEAKAPAYTTVDLSARLNLDKLGARPNTYLQLNVTNLFNKFYIGGFDGTTANTFASYPSTTAYLPTPRTITGSISVAF